MSTPDQQLAFSARFLRRFVALACAALLLLGSSANAGTVLQFDQTNPADIVTALNAGTSTTLTTTGNVDGGGVSVPIVITNFLGTPGVNIPAFETFVNVTSTGPASTSGPFTFQSYSGTIEFTSLPGSTGVNYLTATFTSATLSASSASPGTASLTASQPPSSLVLTSDFATFAPPSNLSIALGNVSPPVSITGSSISSFTAQNTGTVTASITVIPEPSTLCLSSFAVVFGVLVYRKKR
jgi:hypothetical protein